MNQKVVYTCTLALGAILLVGTCQSSQAATACVNPGKTGCLSTIGAAVAAAAAGDTIQVAAGTYKEDVSMSVPVALIGAGSGTTIIDATGLANGIVVNSTSATGFSGAVVSGFTVENANFQGILVQNASNVTITNNQVLSNDKSLNLSSASGPTCAGLPAALQSGENQDCGEGINLTGVDHSVVSNNVSQGNSGGILISDDTGATFDNVITGNLVTGNPYACGITMASHSTMGVYRNVVSNNQVSNNGFKNPGAGAGVGLFAAGPGNQTYGNVVINNTLTNNGLPGVAMHNHAAPPGAPAVNLNDNVIIGNMISGNGADLFDTATPGTAGINVFSIAPLSGTVISQNVISNEAYSLVVSAPGSVSANLNNFLSLVAVDNLGSGTVNATANWWGCAAGPGNIGCGQVAGPGVTFAAPLGASFSSTQLPGAPTSSGGGGGTTPPATGVTIVVTGPSGAVSNGTNTFQTLLSSVILSAAQSTSSNPGSLSYSWTLSPGYPAAAILGGNTATPTVQFPHQGTYQLTLIVTDTAGKTATTTVTLQYI